jgi:hypothetical protein
MLTKTVTEEYGKCSTCGQMARIVIIGGKARFARHQDMRGVKRNEGPFAPVCSGKEWVTGSCEYREAVYGSF